MTEEYRQQSGQRRDISSKEVLGNPVLCAQFIRDNVNIPCLRNVQPEDIEDVSERYRPYLGTEFESDTVKRISIRKEQSTGPSLPEKGSGTAVQEPLFLVSLTEHKSRVDYDVSMQLLRYMVCIWLDYRKEMEGKKDRASDRKSFRYPAIIPVVYYEGKASWTAERQFLSRISQGEAFRKWIPDFTYEVVRLHDYSNEELMGRGNEMSLIMLFNKIQDVVDISRFLELPKEKLDEMVKDTPDAILDIIVSVMESLCVKIGATEEETRRCVSRVRERRMYLFENMEKMDIQAERRNTAEARAELAKAREEAKAEREKAEAELTKARKEAEAELTKAREKAKAEHEEAEAKLARMQENLIQSVVHVCRRMNTSREQAVREIMKECAIDEETARQKVDIYWETI